MAYTVTKQKFSASKNQMLIEVTADAATQAIETGLAKIDHFSVGYVSMATIVGVKIVPNKDASGTAANGTLGVSGLTSGDVFYVTVYGR